MNSKIKRLGFGAFLGLVGCSDQTFTQLTVLDVFQQDRTNAVDLLVVIDNSCSMIEEQENLARNFEELINTFTLCFKDEFGHKNQASEGKYALFTRQHSTEKEQKQANGTALLI